MRCGRRQQFKLMMASTPYRLEPSGLEEIGVSETLRTKRLKFGVPECSDRREEHEFAEFQ